MRKLHLSKCGAWTVSLTAMLLLTGQAPHPEQVTDQETELGDAAYKELKDKAEIIDKSPLYDALNPLTTAIVRVAQPRYEHPFKFILVHEAQPNAFSVPGGNVYVTDALLYFVKNTEELAGTLCHEVSHTIHHDAMNRCPFRKSYPDVLVVESSQDRNGEDSARALDRSMRGRVFL